MRNLAPCTLEPGPRFNVFSGDNGQGKTNVLETVYVVGTLRSFRTSRLAELIGFEEDEAYIGARVARGGLERVYELTLGERSRKVRLDGKTVRPISKYFGDFNVVLFAPEDLRIPKASPSDRRRFVDRAVFNWRPGFLPAAQSYEKVLKNRNAVLRQLAEAGKGAAGAGDLLAVYDDQLVDYGAEIVTARHQFLEAMRPRFRDAFERITRAGLEADLDYLCGEEVAEVLTQGAEVADVASCLRERLQASRARDLARGATNVGPHRDDLGFVFNGRSAQAFASQGQLRALVLAWKTAEMELLGAAHGDPPVLLLDDVSSELDETRNEYLFDFIRSSDSQCFITTTHRRHVLLDADRVDFSVSKGLISQST